MNAAKQPAVAKRTSYSPKSSPCRSPIIGVRGRGQGRLRQRQRQLLRGCALRPHVERFAEIEGVTAAIAFRKVLPLSISERLVNVWSPRMSASIWWTTTPCRRETALQIALGTPRTRHGGLGRPGRPRADMSAPLRLAPEPPGAADGLCCCCRAAAHGHMSFFGGPLAELVGGAPPPHLADGARCGRARASRHL